MKRSAAGIWSKATQASYLWGSRWWFVMRGRQNLRRQIPLVGRPGPSRLNSLSKWKQYSSKWLLAVYVYSIVDGCSPNFGCLISHYFLYVNRFSWDGLRISMKKTQNKERIGQLIILTFVFFKTRKFHDRSKANYSIRILHYNPGGNLNFQQLKW
jgi:hypothetical protein